MSLIRNMGDSSSSRLQLIFEAALDGYEEQTGMKLIDNPLARQLENCNTMESIIAVLQEQARGFSQFRGDDGKVMKSLKSTVHVLHALSASTVLGEGIGLVRQMALMVLYVPEASSAGVPPCEGSIRSFCYPTFRRSFSVPMSVSF
jgi:hypothetical protein